MTRRCIHGRSERQSCAKCRVEERRSMLPTPEELIEARRTIRRLHHAIARETIRDMGGMLMWDSLVEGGRAIAVTCAYLGSEVDPAYGKAWEKMMDSDD